MKQILIFSILLAFFSVFGQKTVKNQIGTSVWRIGDRVFADNKQDYVISYDKQNHKIREWKVFRDTSGNIIDTTEVEFDINDKETHIYGGKLHTYFYYDNFGNQIGINICQKKDTTKIVYHPIYDNLGRSIQETASFNGIDYKYPITYTYKKNMIIRNENDLTIVTKKRNKFNQLTFYESITNNEKGKRIETLTYKYDKKGKIRIYVKRIGNKVVKKTTHYYERNKEKYQIEEYYNPDYKVITTFKYEYWE